MLYNIELVNYGPIAILMLTSNRCKTGQFNVHISQFGKKNGVSHIPPNPIQSNPIQSMDGSNLCPTLFHRAPFCIYIGFSSPLPTACRTVPLDNIYSSLNNYARLLSVSLQEFYFLCVCVFISLAAEAGYCDAAAPSVLSSSAGTPC